MHLRAWKSLTLQCSILKVNQAIRDLRVEWVRRRHRYGSLQPQRPAQHLE